MRIDKIEIKNFRCFEHLELAFHPRLNVFVGVNGSGKTALLEVLKVAVGSFFLGTNGIIANPPGIQRHDVFYSKFSRNLEPIPPASVQAWGEVDEQEVAWKRSLNNLNIRAKNTVKEARALKAVAENLSAKVRTNAPEATLPLIAYFSTDRLCQCKTLSFDGKYDSRFVGYDRCVDLAYSLEEGEWFKTQELAEMTARRLGEKDEFAELDVVRNVVKQFVPNVTDVYFDAKLEQLCLVFADKSRQTANSLSDGFKNLLVLISNLIVRCLILNPYHGLRANEVPGVVLIDEVDLHLHPAWQRQVVPSLLRAFPNVQFFITTHSPQVLSNVPKESIFLLKNNEAERLSAYTQGRDSNSILQDVFHVGKRPEKEQGELDEFYRQLENKNAPEALRILEGLENQWGDSDAEIVRANLHYQDLLDEAHP
jgi:predicted ATP-binding protein involved in virulence